MLTQDPKPNDKNNSNKKNKVNSKKIKDNAKSKKNEKQRTMFIKDSQIKTEFDFAKSLCKSLKN